MINFLETNKFAIANNLNLIYYTHLDRSNSYGNKETADDKK